MSLKFNPPPVLVLMAGSTMWGTTWIWLKSIDAMGVGPLLIAVLAYGIQFFLLFAYYVLLDRRVQPVDAIRGSVQLVQRNVGQTLIFYILAGLIIIAGFIACLIGIFVAAPVVLLATAYLYRRLTGEQPQLPA